MNPENLVADDRLNREEREIVSRGEPTHVHGSDRGGDAGGARRPRAAACERAGTESEPVRGRDHRVVARRRDGADRDVRSETLHAVRAGGPDRARSEHVSRHRYRGRSHQDLAGPRAHRRGHGSGRHHPDVSGRGSRLHPALAPSVPLAHRLRAAAADRHAAHRRDRRADARAEECGRPAVHRDRPEPGDRRREQFGQGVPHGGIPRHRAGRFRSSTRRMPRRRFVHRRSSARSVS